MARTILFALLFAAAPVAAQTPTSAPGAAPVPSVTLPPDLDRVLRDYEKWWRVGQADSVAALFAADGFALPSGKVPAPGRTAIAKAYAGGGGDLRLRAFAWKTEGNVGWIIGGYRYGEGGGDTGKFVLALVRQNGRWMIGADMDNGNGRPPA